MATTDQLCENCSYFDINYYPETNYGACRRYPPQFDYIESAKTAEEQRKARFPSVKVNDWCGEFIDK